MRVDDVVSDLEVALERLDGELDVLVRLFC
jgi:hypothetical protein